MTKKEHFERLAEHGKQQYEQGRQAGRREASEDATLKKQNAIYEALKDSNATLKMIATAISQNNAALMDALTSYTR